jgi:hypothetical protein
MLVDSAFCVAWVPRGAAAAVRPRQRISPQHGRKLDGVPLLGARPLTRLGDGSLGAVCKLARQYRGAR